MLKLIIPEVSICVFSVWSKYTSTARLIKFYITSKKVNKSLNKRLYTYDAWLSTFDRPWAFQCSVEAKCKNAKFHQQKVPYKPSYKTFLVRLWRLFATWIICRRRGENEKQVLDDKPDAHGVELTLQDLVGVLPLSLGVHKLQEKIRFESGRAHEKVPIVTLLHVSHQFSDLVHVSSLFW